MGQHREPRALGVGLDRPLRRRAVHGGAVAVHGGLPPGEPPQERSERPGDEGEREGLGKTEAWLICDHPTIRKYGLGYAKPAPVPLGKFVSNGYIQKGATLADLVSLINSDADNPGQVDLLLF